MIIVRGLILFLFLNLLHQSKCQKKQLEAIAGAQDTLDSTGGVQNDHQTETLAYNVTTRPDFSNTIETKDILTNKISYYFRYKRKTPESSLASIRKRLNEEKKRDEMMAADAGIKANTNFTAATMTGHNITEPHYGGMNTEQLYNRKIDKIRRLHLQHLNDKPKEYVSPGTKCDFESDCPWSWRKDIANGFFMTSGGHIRATELGPKADANGREFGSFLILRYPSKSEEYHVTSPVFGPTTASCKIHLYIYQEQMKGGIIRIVGDKTSFRGSHAINNHTQWQIGVIHGDNSKEWKKHEMSIGKMSRNFSIILEVVPPDNVANSSIVAFDNIQLYQCYVRTDESCVPHQYRCNGTRDCINSTSICDITEDCPHGDDERQNCHLMPYGSRCSFEDDDWCGWQNDEGRLLRWTRHNGSTPTNYTGPNFDHTYMNSTGNYLYVKMLMDGSQFASAAVLKSVVFNPPPRVHGNVSSRFYNSCAIRFYLHKTGKHKSGILLQVTEMKPAENESTNMLWSYMDDHGDQWVRQVFILPNISHKYFLLFEARKGYRYMSDVAIDDVSLSPECFGLNIPSEELHGYNYWNPRSDFSPPKETHPDFKNQTYYKITTCNAKGRFGPKQNDCDMAYNSTNVSTEVANEVGLDGIQKWTVPHDGYYTFILAGASGGKGSSGMGSSRGAMVRTVLELTKGEELFMLIGQEGISACVKVLGQQGNSSCANHNHPLGMGIRDILYMDIKDSGGGGGGATYLFMRNNTKEKILLAVAAGGGGLGGLGRFIDSGRQHGQAINTSILPFPGEMYGTKSAGAGGGWKLPTTPLTGTHMLMMGRSLEDGGTGGKACYNTTDARGDGGFGGGGGGCRYGGGGGGYAGGDTVNTTNGDGGYSYLDPSLGVAHLAEAHSGYNAGSGYILVIPAVIGGCGCDYGCIALDARRSQITCICPNNWSIDEDKKTCITQEIIVETAYPTWFVIGLIVTVVCLALAFGVVCFILYSRYQQRARALLRQKMLTGADLQLGILRDRRVVSDSMMTEYNPNYEFGGMVYTLKDLKDIPREQLRLVKALGQGAFGEVYQGFYRQRPCDTVEMPVAVKTLPEMSTTQAEMDFLMEALIMFKFNHPNIVHFIGVCFDKHPRFIVLELLAGGDLKNFLRESRPKPERCSPLSMKDLILIAVDVAKGCKYLEDNRFIHRDIAARNCLLTTKGPGRVVKIADFGMSRDVYRSDYYRKGGKAMLPIKWMPPEAFLDGIFTSKTDVWSFGVLLWEILKMGYMPYTGCTNREVMDLVVQGGRLEQPENCPGPIYGIMTQCWHPKPEQRPTFATILERLGYCAQDPEVMNASLPVFQKAPSNERDTTVMRPQDADENCLQVVPAPSDYLIPNHTTTVPIESTSSVEKLLPDNSDNWETSFIMANSKSTQPLLPEHLKDYGGTPSASKYSSKVSPTPPQNVIVNNHNNNTMKTDVKSGVSLDASALVKASMTPNQSKKYANVVPGDGKVTNGILANLIPKNESEINC